jgi:hypothetical protein
MITKFKLEELKDEFLMRGGVFLRKNTSKQGEFIIENLTKNTYPRWKTRLTFTSVELRDKNFNHLTRKRKQFFKAF